MTELPWNWSIWEQLSAPRARSAHAWLFAGPRGVGKTQCALAFARHLVGADNNEHAARWFDAGTHPDIHVIVRDLDAEGSDALEHRYARRYIEERKKGVKPKTVITVAQIRHLGEALHGRAHSGRYKPVLLLGAHHMNVNAANALLKFLEEPPEDTVVVAVTDQIHRLPATVRSRCAILRFSIPPRAAAHQWLASHTEPGEVVAAALSLAGGAPLEAARLIREGRLETRERWLAGLDALCSGKSDPSVIAELGKRIGLEDTLSLSQKVLLDLLRCRLGGPVERLFNPDKIQWLQKRAQRLHLAGTFTLIDALGRMRQDIDGPLDTSLLLEDTLTRMRRALSGSP